MSTFLSNRPAAREAGHELLILAKWEEFTGWLLEHTAKWPKSARFGLEDCSRYISALLDSKFQRTTAKNAKGAKDQEGDRSVLSITLRMPSFSSSTLKLINSPRGLLQSLR